MITTNGPQLREAVDTYGLKLGKDVKLGGPVNWGSEPYLIEIGELTTISFDVAFVTHDAATRVIRNLPGHDPDTVIYGKIKVGKNCFIGCRSIILPGVTIGDNCIIGAGSVVNKDIPSNSVAAGTPCKVICTLDEYIDKHKDGFMYCASMEKDEKRKFLEEYFKDK